MSTIYSHPPGSHPLKLGIIGWPVGHSLSPKMHSIAGRLSGINLTYSLYPVKPEELETYIKSLSGLGIDGINVTVPHKQKVIPYLDFLDPSAEKIGAVNTIVNRDGKLHGYNTDGFGLATSIRQKTDKKIEGSRIFIHGAGGAARGIVYALVKACAGEIIIANRTYDKAQRLAHEMSGDSVKVTATDYDDDNCFESIGSADIIINSTSLGLEGENVNRMPPFVEAVSPGAVVVDIVYNPLETLFMKRAKERGAELLDGLWMLVYQGAKAFELFTGSEMDVDQVRKLLEVETSRSGNFLKKR